MAHVSTDNISEPLKFSSCIMSVLSATKRNKADEGIESNGQIMLFWDVVFKEVLSIKETFEQKSERSEKVSHTVIQGRAFPHGRNFKSEGSVGRACVKCLRNPGEFSVAGK